MSKDFKIEIFPDPETAAERCLQIFVSNAIEQINKKNIFNFAVPGGNTPKRFFEMLGESEQIKNLPWDRINLFWVDERYAPPDSQLSNFNLAYNTFLTKIPIHRDNVFRIFTEYSDMRIARREYDFLIRSFFNLKQNQFPQFDLIFLGMGSDGHIASLFPENKALSEKNKLAAVVDDVTPARITLTAPVLTAASKIILLITGLEKAEILKKVMTTEPNPQKYPVHLLWQVLDKLTWVLDSEAAKLI